MSGVLTRPPVPPVVCTMYLQHLISTNSSMLCNIYNCEFAECLLAWHGPEITKSGHCSTCSLIGASSSSTIAAALLRTTLLARAGVSPAPAQASAMNQDKDPAPPHTGASASGHLISSPHTLHISEQGAWRNQLNADTLHLHAKSYRIIKT